MGSGKAHDCWQRLILLPLKRFVLCVGAAQRLLILQLIYASDIFFLITMWCSKCAVALTFIRLTPQKRHKSVAKGIIIATCGWLLTSIFLISLRCDLSHPWIFVNTKCTDLVRFPESLLRSMTYCYVGHPMEDNQLFGYSSGGWSFYHGYPFGERPPDGDEEKDLCGDRLWPPPSVSQMIREIPRVANISLASLLPSCFDCTISTNSHSLRIRLFLEYSSSFGQ